MDISVIICTYNPNLTRLAQTLSSLQKQSLDLLLWELIIVDNNSSNGFDAHLDLCFFPNSRIVREQRQGLTYARLKGFDEAKGEIIIMVDDDNILQNDYLQKTINLFKDHPRMGSAGGKSLPEFECATPAWLKEFYGNLALRDLGNDAIITKWENSYPNSAPIGAGMAIRKVALQSYIDAMRSDKNMITDRTDTSLTSGGDNEINIQISKSGWEIGYFPELVLWHIIPQERMQVHYLARLLRDTNRSWVQLLEKYHINPWKNINKQTLLPRKVKAYLSYKAWKNEVNFIKWQGACGMLEGRIKS
ncbi:glycosyltransferase [Mucilaginibacter lappiensis]|uniref:Glycosyltransferase involved in cell wall biosynthesis n=1 Tax=Mucilaginibacter lappiensis TaxID=354630 RepID=A0A841JBN1_9SPHI|nr:glycosyltransferase [Mucilaginibacter lappiensis]MBB6128044.1 glycosyltransferase involved in cell wall biosynthesis [Mucilaginibacter lappiensis]